MLQYKLNVCQFYLYNLCIFSLIFYDKNKEFILKRIKKTKKEWIVIRFWENDINNDTKKVYNLLEEMKLRSDNAKQFKSIICKIKKYYKEKC